MLEILHKFIKSKKIFFQAKVIWQRGWRKIEWNREIQDVLTKNTKPEYIQTVWSSLRFKDGEEQRPQW